MKVCVPADSPPLLGAPPPSREGEPVRAPPNLANATGRLFLLGHDQAIAQAYVAVGGDRDRPQRMPVAPAEARGRAEARTGIRELGLEADRGRMIVGDQQHIVAAPLPALDGGELSPDPAHLAKLDVDVLPDREILHRALTEQDRAALAGREQDHLAGRQRQPEPLPLPVAGDEDQGRGLGFGVAAVEEPDMPAVDEIGLYRIAVE